MEHDHPISALLCSIFLGPLGIQGWIVSRKNPKYGFVALHQRNISIAIYALIILYLIFNIIHFSSTTDRQRKNEKASEEKSALVQVASWIQVAIALTVILSFGLAVWIVIIAHKEHFI